MPDLYIKLRDTVRALRINRLAARMTPDIPVTRDVPTIGRFTFSIRRQRWLLGQTPFRGHAPVLGLFHHMTRPGDVFYDIGANIGYYARYTLAHLDVSMLVAFEPYRSNLKLLRRNLADFGDRVRIIEDAVGDVTEDDVELQADDMTGGSAVLSKVSGGVAAEGRAAVGLGAKAESVRMVTLDSLLAGEPTLPPPNVMKVDTEGAEHLVLAGAERTLSEHKPRLILAAHGAERAALMLDQLHRLGYTVAGWAADRTWRTFDTADRMGDNNCIASTDPADVEQEPPPAPM